jgi:hypothetical protein
MTEPDSLRQKVETLEEEVARLKRGTIRRGIRKRSRRSIWGLPLYEIALGPDPDRQEVRGHARGVLAIGDIATGFVALGGVARGGIAVGGVAIGGLCLGGVALGLIAAIGGLAVGSVAVGGMSIGLVALGGGAVGLVAVGGGAFGYYACGGGAYGEHVLDAVHHDPEAVRFFSKWLPGLREWLE